MITLLSISPATFVGCVLIAGDVVAQQIITVCGASSGYGYYLEPTRDGWQQDGIKNGTITVIRDSAGAYDVILKDTMTTFSARGDGAQVVKVDGSDHHRFTLVAVYPLDRGLSVHARPERAGNVDLV
jgi:hypothetical protein